MDIITNRCICVLLYLRGIIPDDVITIIIMFMMMENPKIKTYVSGENIFVLKNGHMYVGKITNDDDIYLNKSTFKNVKSIYFSGDAGEYEIIYDVKMSGEFIKSKCGIGYEICLSKELFLFAKGSNFCGQLGLGDFVKRTTFERINLPHVIKFWSGFDNS